MRHSRFLLPLALATILPAVLGDDVTSPGDPGSDGTPPPPPPETIEDISYAADIVPGSAEFEVFRRPHRRYCWPTPTCRPR